MLKGFLQQTFEAAFVRNRANIVRLARTRLNGSNAPRVCDLGAGSGILTTKLQSILTDAQIDCVEIHPPYIKELQAAGFRVLSFDLNGSFAIPDAQYDLVVSNQVFEHLYDTDIFLSETFRVLKPGGFAIVSTENAASWHNIAALLMGWQPFSLTNITSLSMAVGNPFALHNGEEANAFPLQHHRIVALSAMKALFRLHGFSDVTAAGSGYYPLPSWIGSVNPRHAHFITVAGQKPNSTPSPRNVGAQPREFESSVTHEE